MGIIFQDISRYYIIYNISMKTMKRFCFCILFSLFILSLSSFSQENKDDYHVSIPEFTSPPKIDGILENPLWEKGAVLDTFTQYQPQEGAQPSEKTVVYLGHDKNNLYIAVRCFDSRPKAIRASLCQRDKVRGDDDITIYLDTFNDKKRAFVFQVNPCGVQTDAIYNETALGRLGRRFSKLDKNWDTFFISDANIDDSGYTIELAIPFKSIRFPNSPSQEWGLQIMRTIKRKNESIYWFPRSRNINGFLIQAGTLEIDGVIEKGKNIEIMPVFTGLKQSDRKFDPEGSLNLKYGITSDLTADITYNPDFSQVEADMPQVEVNQRFPLYYPEKRPFFLEGKDFFDTPLELVYTRQIVNPQWGVKFTGKMGRTTLGFLSAYDENPPGIYIGDPPDEDEDEEEEEDNPYKALVSVFRLKRDLYSESYIGFIINNKEMGRPGDSITDNYNRALGVDGQFKLNKYYRFSFQILSSQSKVENKKTDFVPAMRFLLNRVSRHLNFMVEWNSIHPEFEGSVGFFRRKGIQDLFARISYSFLPQNDLIISIIPTLAYIRIYDYDNNLTDDRYRLSWFISGWRHSHITAQVSSGLERYEGINFRRTFFQTSFSSDPFSWLSGRIFYFFGEAIKYDDNPYLGYKTSFGVRLTLKPLTNLRIFYNFKRDDFYRVKGGEKDYKINIISQRINYQFSRYLALRLTTDYNDYDGELYTSILLRYEYRPGTVFYLGIDDNQEKGESGIFQRSGRYYFIKFSYWWRF